MEETVRWRRKGAFVGLKNMTGEMMTGSTSGKQKTLITRLSFNHRDIDIKGPIIYFSKYKSIKHETEFTVERIKQ